ncbi:MAG: guanylate kinase [Leptospiraceae bacterium]|nr:guanylate kinase [Leptospiraceae bacterium]
MENAKNLFIISSVAGGGKSTLIDLLLRKHNDILFSVSYTSREKRSGEKDGMNYHFVDRGRFESLIEVGFFYEWALVHDNYYGTPKDFIIKNLEDGHKIILDIDVQGARKVKESLPGATAIFILPPSKEVWIERLRKRGTENKEIQEKRIRNGLKELELQDSFDHKIINDDLHKAFVELENLIYPEVSVKIPEL